LSPKLKENKFTCSCFYCPLCYPGLSSCSTESSLNWPAWSQQYCICASATISVYI